MQEFITDNNNTIIVYTICGIEIITTLYNEENILCCVYNTENELICIFTLWMVNGRYNYNVLKNIKKVKTTFIEDVVEKLVEKLVEL